MKLNISDYRIVKKIHEDYNKCSYSYLQSKTDSISFISKNVAISDKSYQWFNNEINLLIDREIPGVLTPRGIRENNGSYTLILEGFSGYFLKDFIKDRSLSLEELFEIAIQVCSTIHEIHQHDIIHCNLNLDSIIIDPVSLSIRVTNFNIATLIGEKKTNLRKELDYIDIAYVSPEQTGRANYPIDFRSDLYSLGVILYQLLTGVLPFQATDPLEYIHYHLAQSPVSPNEINLEIEPIIASIVIKLLEKDPKCRYQSAWGILKDLEECQSRYKLCGKIDDFELCVLDSSSKFKKSSKIYGREDSIKIILDSLERTYSGAVELIILSGQIGIGKTSLVEDTADKNIHHHSFFLKGFSEEKDSKTKL